ncbi:tropomyosin isoform X1 [Penaeus vannamei]|uniref:tropomyosin isoform X1 n=1 Tax=Penaeus vannamei TaxID=6689 RepID=UPI00387FACBF
MLGLALLSLCAVGWASAAPRDEDLRASVVFNQLAIAQLLDNVSNISRGDAAVTTQLAQLSRSHTAQTQQLSEGLARVTSSVDLLSQALTSHLRQDDVINRDTFMPSDFVEKVKAQENELQELLQRNNQTAAVIQQLEGQSLQLQNEVDLRRQEAQQKEDSIGQLKASIRRVKDDTLQLLAKGSDTEAEKASLQAKTQALKDQVAAEKALRPQKQATKSQLDQQVAELESHSKEIRQQMARLDQELEQLEQRKATAEGEKRAQLERNADLKEAKEDALAAETRIQTGIDQLTGRIRSLEAENKVLEGQKKKKEDALVALRASLASKNVQKEDADGRLSDIREAFEYECLY